MEILLSYFPPKEEFPLSPIKQTKPRVSITGRESHLNPRPQPTNPLSILTYLLL